MGGQISVKGKTENSVEGIHENIQCTGFFAKQLQTRVQCIACQKEAPSQQQQAKRASRMSRTAYRLRGVVAKFEYLPWAEINDIGTPPSIG